MKTALFSSYKSLLAILFFFISALGWGQITIFSENMGSPSGTTAIASNTFQNSSPITFSGTADVRNTAVSSGYSGASGNGNVFFTSAGGRNFIVSGINTSMYSSIQLSFGYLTTTTSMGIVLEYSSNGGTSWNNLGTYTNSNTNWALKSAIAGLPSSTNLSIKFTVGVTGSGARIDDIKLIGTASSCTAPTPTWITTPSNSVCPETDQFYETQSGMSNYQWNLQKTAGVDYTIISGGTTTDHTMTVRFKTKGGNRITVGYTSSGGCASTTPAVWDVTVNGVSIGPLEAQNITAGANGNQLNPSEDGMVLSREWKYSTVSGGPYVSFSTPVKDFSYTPNFADAGTYYVVCESSFSSCVVRSNEITINVAALQKPVISSANTKSNTYGTAGNYSIAASNSPTSYAITSPSTLPAGFSFNSSTGVLSSSANTDAGIYSFTLTASNSAGASTPFNLTWTQGKKNVTIIGVTVDPKVYDQTTTATLNFGAASINTLLASDAGQVNISNTDYAANYINKNVGINKTVTITGVTLAGARSANYNLSAQPTANGNITKKDITVSGISANDKVYDTTTSATFNTSGISYHTVYSGDELTSTVSGVFQTADVGSNIPISITAINFAGTDGGNYQVNPLPIGITANITKATPIISPSSLSPTLGDIKDLTTLVTSTNTATPLLFEVPVANGIVSLPTATTISADAIGSTTLTVTQAANSNYEATSLTVMVTVNTTNYKHGDYRTKTSGTWSYNSTATGTTIWEKYDSVLGWQDYSGQPPAGTDYKAYLTKTTEIPTNSPSHYNATIIIMRDELTNIAPTLTFNSSNIWIFRGITINDGATLYMKTRFTVLNGLDFEIMDNGNFIYDYTSNAAATLISNLWNGNEKFHPNSNFIVKNHRTGSNNYFLPPAGNIDSNIYDGVEAYFGNLKFESTGDVLLTTSNLSGTAKYLTHNDFEITSPGNYGLIHDNGTWVIGRDLKISGPITITTGAKINILKIKRNLVKNGTGSFRLVNNTSGNVTLDVDGDININAGAIENSNANGGTSVINLKGDLYVSSTGQFLTTVPNSSNTHTTNFNFTGTGNGLTPANTQTIDVANSSTASNVVFNANAGSYVKLINQDLTLGSNSKFNVLSGGTLDFGFKSAADNTALNIVRNSAENGTSFENKAGSTLIITSPKGIYSLGSPTNYIDGNIRVITRTYDPSATYHYIGKVNQVTGNGLPKDASNKHVIIELADDSLEFTSDNGIIRFNNPNSAVGTNFKGLEIRKGTVISDNLGNRFEDSAISGEKGNLKMTGGKLKLIAKDLQPSLTGVYELFFPSKIDFALTHTTDTQKIRGGTDYIYPAIDVSGKSVLHTSANINLQSNGTFTVKNGAIITSQGSTGQIISTDDSLKATLTVESNGNFVTQREKGFSGPVNGIEASASVRTDYISGNININLENGSTVEYSRAGDQTITNAAVTTPADSHYANLKITGSGTKIAIGETKVNGITTIASADATLLVPGTADLNPEVEGSTPPQPNAFFAKAGIENTNGTTGKFILGNNAMLMQNPDADNTKAKIQVERISKMKRLDYTYWGSPVQGQIFKDFSPNTIASRFYTYNEIDGSFAPVVNYSLNAFTPAKGYAIRAPNTWDAANQQPWKGTFTGRPNNENDNISIDLDYHGVSSVNPDPRVSPGLNMIANPFPSNIDLSVLKSQNSTLIDGVFYFWTNTTKFESNVSTDNGVYGLYSANNYATLNLLGPVPATQQATGNPLYPSKIIKPGQGFLVHATAEGSLSFNNAIRTTDNTDGTHHSVFFSAKNADAATDRYWLYQISPAENRNMLLIGYVPMSTNGYDSGFDAPVMPSADSFYSIGADKKLTIQGRNYPLVTTDIVPLGSSYFKSGNYTIGIQEKEGIFAKGQQIYLKDKHTGIVTNLSQGTYSFTAEAGENDTRFEILYEPQTVLATGGTPNENLLVYRVGDNFVIKSATKKITGIDVYDSTGKLILESAPNQAEVRVSGAHWINGVYILKIHRAEEVSTRKILK